MSRRLLNSLLLFGVIAGFACVLVYAIVLWYYHYISLIGEPIQYVIFYENVVPIRVTEIIVLTSALVPLGALIAVYLKKVIRGR